MAQSPQVSIRNPSFPISLDSCLSLCHVYRSGEHILQVFGAPSLFDLTHEMIMTSDRVRLLHQRIGTVVLSEGGGKLLPFVNIRAEPGYVFKRPSFLWVVHICPALIKRGKTILFSASVE